MGEALTYELLHRLFPSHQIPEGSPQAADERADLPALRETLQDVSGVDVSRLLAPAFLRIRPRSFHLAQGHSRGRTSALPAAARQSGSRSAAPRRAPAPAGRDPPSAARPSGDAAAPHPRRGPALAGRRRAAAAAAQPRARPARGAGGAQRRQGPPGAAARGWAASRCPPVPSRAPYPGNRRLPATGRRAGPKAARAAALRPRPWRRAERAAAAPAVRSGSRAAPERSAAPVSRETPLGRGAGSARGSSGAAGAAPRVSRCRGQAARVRGYP